MGGELCDGFVVAADPLEVEVRDFVVTNEGAAESGHDASEQGRPYRHHRLLHT
jgi:hypothetical protein